MDKTGSEDLHCYENIAADKGLFVCFILLGFYNYLQVVIRQADTVETVEVEEGLGQVYNKDTDTFDIMNEEQFAFK